jgi:hypothetical protein
MTTRMSITRVTNCRSRNKPSPSSHRFVLRSTFAESSQVALERLFSRRLSIRSEPVFEIPDPDPMLDLGLFDGDGDRRILMDPVDPIILTKHVQSPSYSFIETTCRDFDAMFRAVCIETRYSAGSERHTSILAFRFLFAKSLTSLHGRE